MLTLCWWCVIDVVGAAGSQPIARMPSEPQSKHIASHNNLKFRSSWNHKLHFAVWDVKNCHFKSRFRFCAGRFWAILFKMAHMRGHSDHPTPQAIVACPQLPMPSNKPPIAMGWPPHTWATMTWTNWPIIGAPSYDTPSQTWPCTPWVQVGTVAFGV